MMIPRNKSAPKLIFEDKTYYDMIIEAYRKAKSKKTGVAF